MEFYIAQAISIITCVLAVITMQFKGMKNILIGQIIVNLTTASTYFLLGGISGAGICFIAIVQSIVMLIFNVKNIKPGLWLTVVFIALYIACSVVYYKSPIDILSGLAAVCFAVSVVQTESSVSRRWFVFNPLCWLTYDIFTKAYVNFGMHFVIFISIIVSMFRNDIRKKNEK